jgi:hypothetical protein
LSRETCCSRIYNIRPNLPLALKSIITEYGLSRKDPKAELWRIRRLGRGSFPGCEGVVAVAKKVKFALGKFARFCIDTRDGDDFASAVQLAFRHYGSRLGTGRAPVGFPDFCRDLEAEGPMAEFELSVDDEIQAMLGSEARRYGISLDRMAAHAVFVYLADLESGSPAGAG